MEHLVESHLGGYYISDDDPEIIERYCEQCGDRDWIILSWEKGKKLDTLKDYFIKEKMTKEEIENAYENKITKEELIDDLKYKYECDRCLINNLEEINELEKEEQLQLLKQISISQKNQFKLLKSIIYNDNLTKVYK